MSTNIKIFAVLLIAFAGFCGQAFAHAHLTTSEPADKQTLTTSPAELDLHFTEELNAKFSGVQITGGDGKSIRSGEASLADMGKTLKVSLPEKLAAGAYTVDWHVLSTDGHKSSGSFSFTVKP